MSWQLAVGSRQLFQRILEYYHLKSNKNKVFSFQLVAHDSVTANWQLKTGN
jgi:hypothetical protein